MNKLNEFLKAVNSNNFDYWCYMQASNKYYSDLGHYENGIILLSKKFNMKLVMIILKKAVCYSNDIALNYIVSITDTKNKKLLNEEILNLAIDSIIKSKKNYDYHNFDRLVKIISQKNDSTVSVELINHIRSIFIEKLIYNNMYLQLVFMINNEDLVLRKKDQYYNQVINALIEWGDCNYEKVLPRVAKTKKFIEKVFSKKKKSSTDILFLLNNGYSTQEVDIKSLNAFEAYKLLINRNKIDLNNEEFILVLEKALSFFDQPEHLEKLILHNPLKDYEILRRYKKTDCYKNVLA